MLIVRFVVALQIYRWNTYLINYDFVHKWQINSKKIFPEFSSSLDISLEMKPILIKAVEPVVTLTSNIVFSWLVAVLVKYENKE